MIELLQVNPFDWVSFIAGPGFAVAVAVYLLTQAVPAINRLIESVTKMQSSVDRLNDSVNFLAGRTPQQRLGDTPGKDYTNERAT